MRTKRVSNKTRQFTIGSDTTNTYIKNEIRTSKYTKINFLPKAIILQFRRLANVYFLITAVLQNISAITSLSPISAVAPFILVITLSVIREGIEDIPRQKSDKKVNSSLASVLDKDGHYKSVKWVQIKVGDILLVKDGEEFPTDLVLLKSAHENGLAFIETANLDGEKNLKPKFALSETAAYFEGQALKNRDLYKAGVYAQSPDPLLYNFEGAFVNEQGYKTALQPKQLLLRGSKLQNVEWIIGTAVYTGHDTKIMKNSEKSKTKESRIEHLMNMLIIAILIVQAVFCIITALGNRIWNGMYLYDHWYLPHPNSIPLEAFYTYLSYFLLINTMIPISLIVTIEVVKFVQALLMQCDEYMYSAEKEKGAKVFCSSINEELGLVDYVFSDKTGTLTCNEMIFKNFVIGKEVYGEAGSTDLSEESSEENQNGKQNDKSKKKFSDERLHQVLEGQGGDPVNLFILGDDGKEGFRLDNQKDLVFEFLQAVSTCHECLAEKKKEGGILYQGQSQDEVRLVETASDVGFKFLGGSLEKIQVHVYDKVKEFKMLQVFDFTSERKRMSTLVRDGNTIKLYIKGADNVIMDRLRTDVEQPFQKQVEDKLEEFSRKGFRTLVYAMKTVSENDYKKLRESIDDVAASEEREKKINEIADAFEKGFYLIGCTAVEDKLQENVPKVIHDLLNADIKVWMLTGDKLETAENIAHSCHLIRGDMNVMRCYGKNRDAVQKKLDENREEYNMCIQQNRKKAFIVEGEALGFIMVNDQMKQAFIDIVLYCDAVICCRAAPKQKAEMVRIVKEKTKKVTLAIGDGANDVNMIQAANIGVGLYGHEGVQAVQASDYAIPEFQGLWRLVIVHGRWSYLRISEMILYFFYKNMLFTLPQFYYAFMNGFSAMTIYDDFYVTTYNLIFTALPLGAKAVLEKDVDYRIRLSHREATSDKVFNEDPRIKNMLPRLYAENKKNLIFTPPNFLYWIIKGLIMAILLFVFAVFGVANHTIDDHGTTGSLWFMSIGLYTSVILVVTVKLCSQTRYWNIFFVGFLFILSLALYFAFTVVYDKISSVKASYTVGMNYGSVVFYAYVIFFTGFELLIDMTREGFKKGFHPTSADLLRQQVKLEKKEAKKGQGKAPVSKNPDTGFELLSTSKHPNNIKHSKETSIPMEK